MIYQWKTGFHSSVDAGTVGNVCEKIASNGGLTASKLVDYSRPESSETHCLFDWNDETAAEKWREHTARNVINHLTIEVEQITVNDEPVKVRAFFPVPDEQPEQRSYHTVTSIMQDEDKRDYVMETALRELKSFREKYSTLGIFKGVMIAIDEVIEKVEE